MTNQLSRRMLLAASAMLPWVGHGACAKSPVRIATIGSGRVGSALGTAWAKAGHDVMFSSRHPDNLKDLVTQAGPRARAGTVEQAVKFADVVLLAVPYGAMPELAREHGAALAKKDLVFDSNNPFPDRDGEVANAVIEKGAGRYVAGLLPGARIVRTFNAIPAARMGQGSPREDGRKTGMPLAGDDPAAIALAEVLIRELGYEPVLVGNLEFGKHLRPREPLAGEHTADEIRAIAATLK